MTVEHVIEHNLIIVYLQVADIALRAPLLQYWLADKFRRNSGCSEITLLQMPRLHNLILLHSVWRCAARSASKHAKDTIVKWNKIMTAKEEA